MPVNFSTYKPAYTAGGNGMVGNIMGLSRKKDEEREVSPVAGTVQKGNDKTETKLRKAAEDFVGIFMSQIMKSMRATVNENKFMNGDKGEKYFQEMMDDEYVKKAAQGGGYGLTDLVYKAMARKANINPDASMAGNAAAPEAVGESQPE